jgi:hypothetical protein
VVERLAKISGAGSEDRATLESDLSADVGAYTDGQGVSLCPFIAHPVCEKAINSFPASKTVGPLGGGHGYHPRAFAPIGLALRFC